MKLGSKVSHVGNISMAYLSLASCLRENSTWDASQCRSTSSAFISHDTFWKKKIILQYLQKIEETRLIVQ